MREKVPGEFGEVRETGKSQVQGMSEPEQDDHLRVGRMPYSEWITLANLKHLQATFEH